MLNSLLILFGKLLIYLSKNFNLGSGSTWPGHIALSLNPNFIRQTLALHPKGVKLKVIIIAGTNGKTTTGKLIAEILRANKKNVLHNEAGANLINGLASTLITGVNVSGKLNQDYLIFESDENALPEVLEQTNPDFIICLDLFRDQLDRYGEIDSIAKKWRGSFKKLLPNTTLILNSDDPQIAYLSSDTKAKSLYFGLEEEGKSQTSHGADTTYCPRCLGKLEFQKVFFSHLGIWSCPKCGLRRPKPNISSITHYPLSGTYNKYNSLAASLFAKSEGIKQDAIDKAFKNFSPAFGRGEKIVYKQKNVQVFLSKNPTSFNQSLVTAKMLGGKNLLILLNDRIPDGLDVSWIWDINMEELLIGFNSIIVSGDRCYDMGLRIKYCNSSKFKIEPSLQKALGIAIANIATDEVLYVLANYSSMLDIRKILTGKKIL